MRDCETAATANTANKRIGASRRQVNTVTLESEFNNGPIIDFLRNSGFDVEISREQTSMYDGKVIIKVFEVEDAKYTKSDSSTERFHS